MKCANCGEKHRSTDKKCKVYEYNVEVKKAMAENNVSFKEAESLVVVHKPQIMPSLTSKRFWPEIEARNSLTLEDIRRNTPDTG